MKQVAVIIINFNSSAYTVGCIQSIVEKTVPGLRYEIIVVDNNSAAADYETLVREAAGYPNLSIHRSIVNLGFSGGNMYGLQFANATYCFFLNNDCVQRLQDKGYTCYLQPEAKFILHMGKSTSRSYAILRENYISLLYYHRKHHHYLKYTLFKMLYFFKNIKRFYKGTVYVKLAFFILRGAPLRYSLKHSQKMSVS